MVFFFTILILLTVSNLISIYAESRGRNRLVWFALGICFGLFALVALVYLPSLKSEAEPVRGKGVDLTPPKVVVDPFAHDEWHFIDINGKQRGPVDHIDLKLAWSDGIATKEAFVWREGMAEWKKICEVNGLEKYLSESRG